MRPVAGSWRTAREGARLYRAVAEQGEAVAQRILGASRRGGTTRMGGRADWQPEVRAIARDR